MQLKAGNPQLKAPYSINSSARLYFANPGKTRYSIISGSINYTLNNIVSRRIYFDKTSTLPDYSGYQVPAGAFLYTFENANPSVSADVSYSLSNRVSALKKLTVNETVSLTYKTLPQYFGDNLLHLHEPGIKNELFMTYAPSRKLRISLESTTAYSFSISKDMRLHSVQEHLKASVSYYFTDTFRILSTYVWTHHSMPSSTYIAINLHEINLLLSKSFFKKRLVVAVSVNDILGSGSLFSAIRSADSLIRQWTPSSGRYYLLSVTYRFNRLGNRGTNFRGGLNYGDR